MNVSELRREYARGTLDEATVARDPIAQFRVWFDAAIALGLPEPNAMTLATATPEGKPSARIVLLKGFDDRGFVFFSNYTSRKGTEIDANPAAALTFFFAEMERQVRVEGRAERVTAEESDAYFLSRPEGSRLGACASHQSRVVADRATLDRRLAECEARARAEKLARPPQWGGYRVVPESVEFWQGRPNRMHDRLRYRLQGEAWVLDRLEP